MITEAIILAGGLGTRLQTVVNDVPKCMAPINGIPFINFVISYLKHEGIDRFIFSLGYKSEMVIEYVDDHFKGLDKIYVVENEQLGTGGAIKKACEVARSQEIVIVNGDTIFNISLQQLLNTHHTKNADCTIALTELHDCARYGKVEFDQTGIITGFHEKGNNTRGYINGGIYILNKSRFLNKPLPEKFSFEKDYLEKYVAERIIANEVFYNYFVDIGVPEDYEGLQKKYAALQETNKKGSSVDGSDIIIETIGAFFELLL
jgi:D-glycero-alpha-D-manno-heptose 1-phosphate guanylyltransferase